MVSTWVWLPTGQSRKNEGEVIFWKYHLRWMQVSGTDPSRDATKEVLQPRVPGGLSGFRRQRREANRRYQQSERGKQSQRDRQRRYRERQVQACVTDQGGGTINSPAPRRSPTLCRCSSRSAVGSAAVFQGPVSGRCGLIDRLFDIQKAVHLRPILLVLPTKINSADGERCTTHETE